jgi:hypothetical protein
MSKRRNVLFTSVGDNSVFPTMWCDENRTYDIYACYYGNSSEKKYEQYSDVYFERHGGKFQNFFYCWNNMPSIQEYDYYFVLDDDIVISTDDINKLFQIMDKTNVWILQPSFNAVSKISHPITKQNTDCIMRYVNYVEVGVMMFNKWSISKCMEIYDDSLVGFGIDQMFNWWLLKDVSEEDSKTKMLIVDEISCINPKVSPNKREINKLQSYNKRVKAFNEVAKRLNFSAKQSMIVYKSILKEINNQNVQQS